MIRHSVFVFILGWVLWFAIEKHPASLGAIVPGETGRLLGNFQLAFDMVKAGYPKAAFVFLWQEHYVVLSIIAGLVSSFTFQAVSDSLRRRKLREVMRPTAPASEKMDHDQN